MGISGKDGFIDPKKEKKQERNAILGLIGLVLLILLVIWGALTGLI